MPNLKSQAKKSFLWDFSGRLLMQGSGFVVTIFLARLLKPSDFGLIAIVAVMIAIAQMLTDAGLNGALIQRRRVLPVHYSSVFYFNIFVALLLTMIVYCSANLIADFYTKKELIPLVQALSFSFIIQSLGSVQSAKLSKELRYPLLTKVKITASLISGAIGILLAFYGAGVWSLVAQSLFMTTIYSLLLWTTSKWTPSLLFSFKALMQLWSFGFRMFLSGLMATIVSQMDVLIIGKIFNPAILGFFQQAKSLNAMIVQYSSGSLMSILFPVLSKVQNDLPRFQNIVIKTLGILSFIVFLLSGVLYLIAHDLILFIFTEKWLPSVEYFKILVLSGFAFPISALLVNILSSRGNSQAFLNLEIYKVIIFAANLYIGFLFGVKGYLYGLIIAMNIAVLINIFYASREIKLSFFIFLKPLVSQAVISSIAVLITTMIVNPLAHDGLIAIFGKGSIFFISYLFISWLFKTTSYLYFIEQIISQFKPNNALAQMHSKGIFMTNKFIIYTPAYDENTGGIIALHRLCDLLNKEGIKAYLWPTHKPVFNTKLFFKSIRRLVGYFLIGYRIPYQTHDQFNTPVASYSDLRDAIVLYPEYVCGNPLDVKNVVRWFLNKPGLFSGKIDYGTNELYFYYAEAFNNQEINPHDNKLQVVHVIDDIYKKINLSERKGTCYILRKGLHRELVHDTKESILIDGLSHQEISDIFNSVEVCISYDLYTLYSHYAAVCGCLSIVVPDANISKEEWHQTHEANRLGIAYGFDDIEHALKTQHLVLPYLKEQEKNANTTVRDFSEKCTEYFANKKTTK